MYYQGVGSQVDNKQTSTNFVQLIKRCAIEAFNASKPTTVQVGKVTKEKPLKIKLGQKLELSSSFLIIPKSLSGYVETVKIDGSSKEITHPNRLKKGAKVIMLRQQGGHKYVVLDIL